MIHIFKFTSVIGFCQKKASPNFLRFDNAFFYFIKNDLVPMLKSGRSHSIGAENSHLVEYPLPLTFTISPFTNSFVTVISFLVRVHVLSVQMIFTLPRVSTDERRRTSTFFFTNLFTPSHSEIVTTAGSHSGIAATARAIAVKKAD